MIDAPGCHAMSPDLREEIARYVPITDEPEIRARQRHVAKVLLDVNPDLRHELIEEGIEKGLRPLLHQFERRLGRPLTGDEQQRLEQRLDRVGGDRLGDVVLDLTPDALAAWLADPGAV